MVEQVGESTCPDEILDPQDVVQPVWDLAIRVNCAQE
jgi:hypothetical protein